jgi:hypothetical protein
MSTVNRRAFLATAVGAPLLPAVGAVEEPGPEPEPRELTLEEVRRLRETVRRNPPPPGHKEIGDAILLMRRARKLLGQADEFHENCEDRHCWCGRDVQGITYSLEQFEATLEASVLGFEDEEFFERLASRASC